MQGVYVLVIELSRNLDISIGSLGTRSFSAGNYVYVGSAQNGLDKRLKRHLGNNKKIFWHIDYLLSQTGVQVKRVFYKYAPRKTECETAANLLQHGTQIWGFGSSDCRCNSHLVRISKERVVDILSDWLIYC